MKRKPTIFIPVTVIIGILFIVLGVTYFEVGPEVRCLLPEEGLAEAGWSARTVRTSGQERCYFLYTPPSLNNTQPSPLVVSYHGFLSNPNSHALITKWHEFASEEGFIVAYPQGTKFPQRWNAGQTWGAKNVNDVEFFNDLLEDVTAISSVDLNRVFVNGFSNGGGLSVRLACDAADKIAAIGSVAGAVVDLQDCNPSRPMPIMAFHGTADPIVNYYGKGMQSALLRRAADLTDAPKEFLGAEDWTSRWAEYNGCDQNVESLATQGDVSGIRYTGCDNDALIYLYTIDGGGHSWPGGWAIPFVGKTSSDIDATKELWGFFQNYQLDASLE